MAGQDGSLVLVDANATPRHGRFMDPTGFPGLFDRFAAEMDRLGPFEPRPLLAVAVSGGADSMALALLAQTWVSRRDGEVIALTVNHGLRTEASAEADLTLRRLAARGIQGHKLTVRELARGPALAERARDARYRCCWTRALARAFSICCWAITGAIRWKR